jgi:protein-disulfide isomerase
MAAGRRRVTSDRPRQRTIAATFGVAILVGIALIAVSMLLRNDNARPATANPVVNLAGIPQQGRLLGSPDAKVTLILYADQQCPGCRAYIEDVFPTVVNEYVRPGNVKVEYRGYPFIGSDSMKAQRFLFAAAEQNKLWNLEEALYRYQGAENSGWVTDDLIRQLAGKIKGLDVDELFAAANRDDIGTAARQAYNDAVAAGVSSTPSLFIQIGDAKPYYVQICSAEQMRAALDDALNG